MLLWYASELALVVLSTSRVSYSYLCHGAGKFHGVARRYPLRRRQVELIEVFICSPGCQVRAGISYLFFLRGQRTELK